MTWWGPSALPISYTEKDGQERIDWVALEYLATLEHAAGEDRTNIERDQHLWNAINAGHPD